MIFRLANPIPELLAMAPAPRDGQPSAPWFVQLFPWFLLLFAFYFVILRPQQRRQKQHDQLMKSLRAGDRVTTTSGIVGIVVTVKDRSVNIRSADTKLEVLKSAISEITEREGEPSPSPSPSQSQS